MVRISRHLLPLAATALAAASLASAQETDVKGDHDLSSGLIRLEAKPATEIEIVTTEAVPGKACKSVGAPFPVMALPAGSVNNIPAGATRSARALLKAAAEAGANAVVGFRTSTFVTRNGNARLLVYGTLARCE